jgi:formylglycine-generating enzyme required for sulfatase activity/tRNA A-37 threonylcarbamoyl transferase component Bud32
MAKTDELVGSEIGQYRILELIGKGGMASVYKATQESINRTVAIKVLPHSLLHDSTFLERFQREAEMVAQLEHFHILPIYDYGEHEGMPYIVMRYLAGGTLQDRIKQGPLPWDDIVRITEQVAMALDYAHGRNIIHRDIKPSNVLLDAGGNAYLADFGIAKMTEATAHLTGSGFIGTPAYMAPEQSKPGPPTPSMDIYALGVAVFQMITGQVPYLADTPIAQVLMHIQQPVPSARDHNPDVPPAVDETVQRAMAKSPEDRYSTAGEFANALEKAVAVGGTWEPQETLIAGTLVGPTPTPAPAAASASSSIPAAPGQVPGVAAPAERRPSGMYIGLAAAALVALIGGVLIGLGAMRQGGAGGPASASTTETPTDTPAPTEIQPTDTSAPTEKPTEVSAEGPTAIPAEAPTPTETPTELPPTLIQRSTEMVLVPAGAFTMGNNNGLPAERPEHELYLDAFYIDKYEVTNVFYRECVTEGGCSRPLNTDSPTQFNYFEGEYFYEYPFVYATWNEADNYCRWRGGHLPTEAQWEKAARWNPATGEVTLFPWGNATPVTDLLNFKGYIGETTRVDRYEVGKSLVGAYDMAGNLREWVNDWYQSNYYELSPAENPPGPESGEFRVLRGGSYESAESGVLSTRREYESPGTSSPLIGFRCAFTPSGDPTGR